MKQKKNIRAKKVLLMGISCVLVAALSVSFTLAYLTAKTNEKDNLFKASKGIIGEVIEPDYDIEMAKNWKPGDTIPKNPMVDNDTTDYDVWVGASIEYQLSVDGGSNWKTVPYSVFSEYVTVTGKPAEPTSGAGWLKLTPDQNTDLDYYFYNTKLLKETEETEVGYAQTAVPPVFGTTGGVTTDNTAELFTSVTPKSGLDISPKYVNNPNASQIEEGKYPPEDGKTVITDNNNIPTSNIDLSKLAFNSFKFKIKITGYGVKNDDTIAGGNATTLADTDLTNVENAILKGLGGKAA